MKNISILLMLLLFVPSVLAQNIREENREKRMDLRVTINQERKTMLEKQQEARQQMNEDIRKKMEEIQANPSLSPGEKARMVAEYAKEKRKEYIEQKKTEKKAFAKDAISKRKLLQEEIKAQWEALRLKLGIGSKN